MIGPKNGHPMFDFIFEHNLNKNGYFDSVEKRNNLAFTLEVLSEQIMYQFLKDLKDKYPDYNKITFAGGIFANVKLNQFINNTSLFDEIFDSSFDKKSVQLITDICEEISSNKCVFIISHRKDAIYSNNYKTISLQKKNGVTNMLEN